MVYLRPAPWVQLAATLLRFVADAIYFHDPVYPRRRRREVSSFIGSVVILTIIVGLFARY